MKKNVFIIVPVFNVEHYLDRCLQSLRNQTYKHCIVVTVNDGSTDNCPEKCDNYAKEYENFVCIHKPNGGLSDARNAGLDYCFKHKNHKDSYVAFVDADDFLRENCIEECVKICEANSCQLIQCDYERGNMSGFSSNCQSANTRIFSSETALLGYDLKSQSCAKLYQLSLFENERFPVGVWNEDEFMTYKIVFKCNKIAITNAKLYYYYQRQSSIMSDIAQRLKDNEHHDDWFSAYMEREKFFQKKGKHQLVLKTYEKICTDIILRYTEQMGINKKFRIEGTYLKNYLKTYRKYYAKAIKKKSMPLFRRLMYTLFYIFPYSSVVASKFRMLRK